MIIGDEKKKIKQAFVHARIIAQLTLFHQIFVPGNIKSFCWFNIRMNDEKFLD